MNADLNKKSVLAPTSNYTDHLSTVSKSQGID